MNHSQRWEITPRLERSAVAGSFSNNDEVLEANVLRTIKTAETEHLLAELFKYRQVFLSASVH